jgi:hypothetical protein
MWRGSSLKRIVDGLRELPERFRRLEDTATGEGKKGKASAQTQAGPSKSGTLEVTGRERFDATRKSARISQSLLRKENLINKKQMFIIGLTKIVQQQVQFREITYVVSGVSCTNRAKSTR